MKRQVMVMTLVLALTGWAGGGEKADEFWKMYEETPVLQDFFPFGMYSSTGRWTPFGQTPEVYVQMILETFREKKSAPA